MVVITKKSTNHRGDDMSVSRIDSIEDRSSFSNESRMRTRIQHTSMRDDIAHLLRHSFVHLDRFITHPISAISVDCRSMNRNEKGSKTYAIITHDTVGKEIRLINGLKDLFGAIHITRFAL